MSTGLGALTDVIGPERVVGIPVGEVTALAYDSRTKGNVATEIVKYFYQLHFGIKKDYRLPDLLKRGNFYQSN